MQIYHPPKIEDICQCLVQQSQFVNLIYETFHLKVSHYMKK